jgi:glycosyltransferase involved in cell wall biosynthesis
MKFRLLVLYAEVMPYNVACFEDFTNTTGGSIIVISWGPGKKLTPYVPPYNRAIEYKTTDEFDLEKIILLINSFKPALLYVSGRMELMFLEASLFARKLGIPVIGNSDNQYTGSWKQWIYKLGSWWFWKRYFNFMMVPGLFQYEYMRFLGFGREAILFPQYCADTTLFQKNFNEHCNSGVKKEYILFTGRLETIKGLDVLLDAFTALREEKQIDLKLLIVGSGSLGHLIATDDSIVWKGFLSQEEIVEILPRVKFFCLPSKKEPWGVVLHEFAAAGLPIVATSVCGACSAFVKDGYNGFIVPPNSKEALKKVILRMAKMSDEQIRIFGTRSYELSKQITPQMWSAAIQSVIRK